MKKSFILLLTSLFLCVVSFAQTAEQDAIKKVCIAETQAYNNFDYDTWASYHVQSADEQLAWNNPDGSFGFQSGWDEISNSMKDWFKTGKKENPKDSNDNFRFIVHNDIALVSYDITSQKADGKITKIHNYETLLRVKGQWKILTVHAYADYASSK